MVVSADIQKIIKDRKRYKSKKVSYNFSTRARGQDTAIIKLSGKPVSLFIMPFVFALFIFAFYINLSDSYWYIISPRFVTNEIFLPEESGKVVYGGKTLKASINLSTMIPLEKELVINSKALYFNTYTIREDDRYSIIAKKFSIELDSLLSINEIETLDKPLIGSEIQIPNMSGIYYVVRKGDSLSSIATRYNLEIDNISEVNDLYSTVIHSGDKLFLPGVKMESDNLNRIIGHKFLIPSTGNVKNTYGSYLDPVTGLKNYNYGIDIINRKGTEVAAAKDGVIKSTSYNPYYGRVVVINHSGSFQSIYGCLDSIVVTPGQTIKRGEILGYIGNSGFKSSEHLQFSIFKNKEDVDTLEYIF